MVVPSEQPDRAGGVRNVGAVACFSGDAADDPGFANVDLRLFATTDAGERVLDPQGASTRLLIDRAKLAGLDLSVQMSLRLRTAPSGPRLAAWERIVAELSASHGIDTDPVTLHGLGFALVLDEELEAAKAASLA